MRRKGSNQRALSGRMVTTGLTLGALTLGVGTAAAAPQSTVQRAVFGPQGGGYAVVADEVLDRLEAGAQLERFERGLSRRGARLIDVGNGSGILRIRVPAGLTVNAFMKEARRMPFVRDVTPNTVIDGNGGPPVSLPDPVEEVVPTSTVESTLTQVLYPQLGECIGEAPGTVYEIQWNLDRIRFESACTDMTARLGDVIVAVLDTGVAYGEGKDGSYLYSPSWDLTNSPIIAPYDFINDDQDAWDDNGHGTHMTGTIAAQGHGLGVAPAVKIMPVKVLGVDKSGTELALIEGIYHAVENGAQVINMSLSFPLGYFPSAALQDAITFAVDAGAVLVSSSGNAGASGVSYPAALPDVIAVGASRMGQDEELMERGMLGILDRRAEYSNWGFALDMLAPGGRVDADLNWDGFPDAIIAEAFHPGHPDEISHWFMSGTSPAAAHVSGAAAWLLAEGVDPSEVRTRLTHNVGPVDDITGFHPYNGQGTLSLQAARMDLTVTESPDPIYVNMVPWIETLSDDGQQRVGVRAMAMHADGTPAEGVQLGGSFYGSTVRFNVSALTGKGDNAGVAFLYSDAFQAPQTGTAVGFQLDGAVLTTQETAQRAAVEQFYSLSPAMAEQLARVLDTPALSASMLLFDAKAPSPQAAEAMGMGALAQTYVMKPVGPGLRSGAMVMALDQRFLEAHASGVSRTSGSMEWPSALNSGEGPIASVRYELLTLHNPTLDLPETVLVLPLDPALGQLDTDLYLPVINSVDGTFAAVNQSFMDNIPSEPLGSAFAASPLGSGFVSSPLGDAFAASPLGSGFCASPLGSAFAASPLGSAFAASPIGSGFCASAMGSAFVASPLGSAFAASPIGMGGKGTSGAGTIVLTRTGYVNLAHTEEELAGLP